MCGLKPYIYVMENFDHTSPAELFVGSGRGRNRRGLEYHRFNTGDEALTYVRKHFSGDLLSGVVLQIDDERFDEAQIRLHLDKRASAAGSEKP